MGLDIREHELEGKTVGKKSGGDMISAKKKKKKGSDHREVRRENGSSPKKGLRGDLPVVANAPKKLRESGGVMNNPRKKKEHALNREKKRAKTPVNQTKNMKTAHNRLGLTAKFPMYHWKRQEANHKLSKKTGSPNGSRNAS